MSIRFVGEGGEGGRGGAGRESEARFGAYLDSLAGVLGRADRTGPLMDYCTGLLLPGGPQGTNEIGPFERHGEKEPQRGDGGVD